MDTDKLKITSKDIIDKKIAWLDNIRTEDQIFKGKNYLIMKRLFDLVVVICSLPLWIPVILIAALAIKLAEPNLPIFYRGQRTGLGGKRFIMYKFRTMVPNAEELKDKYQDMNELKWPDFKIKHDPRVTRVGKIIRKYSIDEIPQLFNVLKGDMSMVGPRPTFIPLKDFKMWQTKRLETRPGITGLWQIAGRGSSFFDTRIRLEIAYIQKQCLQLDFQILLRTITAVIGQKGSF